MAIRLGSKIILTNTDYDNYDEFKNTVLTVTHIATSSKDHPGYDNAVGGILVDTDLYPGSLYRWEFREVQS